MAPSRDYGPVLLPKPSSDLERRAAVMFARHNALAAEKKRKQA
jgi:hypothetical protein